MASSINASTAGGGGVIVTSDATGNLNIQSGGSTVVAVTSAGVAVTGTLSATGAVTLTTALPVLQGGTGVTTSTGTGAGVHSVGPSISSAVMTTMASSVITSGTAVASTSGTSVDFTSIPSWVKRITFMLSGVSTSGTSNVLVQLGTSSGPTTSGYAVDGVTFNSGTPATGIEYTTGFPTEVYNPYVTAAGLRSGSLVFNNVSGNTWVGNGIIGVSWGSGPSSSFVAGKIALAAALDRIRLTTVNGTDTFDAGSVNILYE